jgi:hypothetical protein
MKKLRFTPHDDSGQSLVELAFSLAFLLLLVAGVIDIGRAFFTYIALRDAAQEGAAYGSIARIYPELPMMCTEIANRAHSTSNTQIVDLNQTSVDIIFYGRYDTNLETPYSCYNLHPETAIQDNTPACMGSTVVVSVTFPNFPLTTPFLGTVIGRQTVPIRATIEDTVLTPPCQ